MVSYLPRLHFLSVCCCRSIDMLETCLGPFEEILVRPFHMQLTFQPVESARLYRPKKVLLLAAFNTISASISARKPELLVSMLEAPLLDFDQLRRYHTPIVIPLQCGTVR